MSFLPFAVLFLDAPDGSVHRTLVSFADYERVVDAGPWVALGGLPVRDSGQTLPAFIAGPSVTVAPVNGDEFDARRTNLKVTATEPMSIKGLCRLTGTSLDGHTREALSSFLDDALFALWESAVEEYDPPHAASIMWRLTSRDPSFSLPLWLVQVYKRHRQAILEDMHECGVAR